MCSSLKITQVCTTAVSNKASRRRIQLVNRTQAASALELENDSSNKDLISVKHGSQISLSSNLLTPNLPPDNSDVFKNGFASSIFKDSNLKKPTKSMHQLKRVSIEDKFRQQNSALQHTAQKRLMQVNKLKDGKCDENLIIREIIQRKAA